MLTGKLKILFIGLSILINTIEARQKPILLFPKGAPGEQAKAFVEYNDREGAKVAGREIIRIFNVSSPTITVYLAPKKLSSGAAMIVCPGGGYSLLAYDLEGEEVCKWLNSIGVTAILLKYRVPGRKGLLKHVAALQDAQRAISYVRANAPQININPQKIGIMGFSAGGHLSAMASNNFTDRTYQGFDAVDTVSCRPDFCLLVYPAYLEGRKFEVAPEINITEMTPPTMLVQTQDDYPFINGTLFYYYALKDAKVPVWMHLYSSGNHGYGVRNTGFEVNKWPALATDWLKEIGAVKKK